MVFHTQRESKTFHECVLITLSYILPLKLDRGTLSKKKKTLRARTIFLSSCFWGLAPVSFSARDRACACGSWQSTQCQQGLLTQTLWSATWPYCSLSSLTSAASGSSERPGELQNGAALQPPKTHTKTRTEPHEKRHDFPPRFFKKGN